MDKKILAVFAAALLVLALCAGAVAVEKPLPIYSVTDVQKLVADNKGKVVVFNFFASWCPPCKEEIPGLIRIRKALSGDKLVLIGVSIDKSEKDLRDYMAKAKFNYPVVKSGPDLAPGAGVRGVPHLLIFNPKGDVVVNQSGYVAESDLRTYLESIME